ncbi:MAG: class I SAM-dependent methyltransferase [Candidatus Omnitrophica bacterium]|nr:class I SAM-dependent methyltransferase [Candidatus Omnitrophota bacterium]
MESDKKLFYERFAGEFDKATYAYDRRKRLKIIFENLLGQDTLKDKLLLDVGCGTGDFSKRAHELGARVISLDLGVNLLYRTKQKCPQAMLSVGDLLSLPFPKEKFDVIVCTEVIEHTSSAFQCLYELHRVLKKRGIVVITMPNKFWYFSIIIAQKLRLRPYEGYENWLTPGELKRGLQEVDFEIKEFFGFNIFPFIFRETYKIIDFFDTIGRFSYPIMVNLAAKAVKR